MVPVGARPWSGAQAAGVQWLVAKAAVAGEAEGGLAEPLPPGSSCASATFGALGEMIKRRRRSPLAGAGRSLRWPLCSAPFVILLSFLFSINYQTRTMRFGSENVRVHAQLRVHSPRAKTHR